ncbi:MAG: hypothetical protein ACREQM_13185 [Candidatus Dormibacteraceae bacterium]
MSRRPADEGGSQADLVRRILDRELGIVSGVKERLAIVDATAGMLADGPDWAPWLAEVRGHGTAERLADLGLRSFSTRPS